TVPPPPPAAPHAATRLRLRARRAVTRRTITTAIAAAAIVARSDPIPNHRCLTGWAIEGLSLGAAALASETKGIRASQNVHQPTNTAGNRLAFHSTAPAAGSLAFHSSAVVRNGMTMLANGMSHHATAHPGVKRRSAAPRGRRFDWPRKC